MPPLWKFFFSPLERACSPTVLSIEMNGIDDLTGQVFSKDRFFNYTLRVPRLTAIDFLRDSAHNRVSCCACSQAKWKNQIKTLQPCPSLFRLLCILFFSLCYTNRHIKASSLCRRGNRILTDLCFPVSAAHERGGRHRT